MPGHLSPDQSPHTDPGPLDADVEAEIVTLARGQHGLVTATQLRKRNLTRSHIRSRTTRGTWTKVAPGVYRVGGAPFTWESQVKAHVFAAGPNALASHRTAAVLWGLSGFHQATPEISVPLNRHYRTTKARVHRSRDLHLASSDRRDQIEVTTVPRTLLDLAGVLSRQELHLAVEEARRRNLVSWEGLLNCMLTHARRGRPGLTAMRNLLEEHADEVRATDSGFECLVAVRLCEAGLPAPVLQHDEILDGRTYRIDLAYPDRRLAIELDGSYHREKATWEADHPRQNSLIMGGWTVLRYTWAFYTKRRGAMLREIRTALDTLPTVAAAGLPSPE